jgi:hypothetical protein
VVKAVRFKYAKKVDDYMMLNRAMLVASVNAWKKKQPVINQFKNIANNEQLSEQMIRRLLQGQPVRALGSSFRAAPPKKSERLGEEFSPQVILQHKLSKLVCLFANRKYSRPIAHSIHIS